MGGRLEAFFGFASSLLRMPWGEAGKTGLKSRESVLVTVDKYRANLLVILNLILAAGGQSVECES